MAKPRNNVEADLQVDDEPDDADPYVEYDIATYPSDLTLSVIHEMWRDKDITIPSFQRNFVWNIKQSSLLIDSFLSGLPVPQVFFYIDNENHNLVIDGHQRIMSVIFFFEGYFGYENLQGRRQVFKLTGLSEDNPHYNKRFDDLSAADQRKLRGSVLRAVNIKQLLPTNQTTSMYHIFERLNTGGTPLRPQEIRNCVFHGGIVQVLDALNCNSEWRKIIGRKALDKHQRDVEMVLRVFALEERGEHYEKPMKEFLNLQMKRHEQGADTAVKRFRSSFPEITKLITEKLPQKPFHIRGPLNLAAMDSIMSVLIKFKPRIKHNIEQGYRTLITDKQFRDAIFYNTSDASAVRDRIRLARQYLID